jgi:hypothetical protein
MSTVKKPVDRQTAEFRVLTDFFTSFFASEEKAAADKWVTPEFVTTTTTVLTNLMAVLVLLGWLNSTDVEALTKAIVALVGAGEVIAVNSILIWKFVSSRLAAKNRVLEMKYQYVEALAIEQMRAAK